MNANIYFFNEISKGKNTDDIDILTRLETHLVSVGKQDAQGRFRNSNPGLGGSTQK